MDATVIQCTICSSKMKLPPTHFGKKLKCPKCQAILVTTAEGKLAKAISAEQAQAAQAAKQQQAGAGGQANAATAKSPQQKPAAAQAPKAAAQSPAQAKAATQKAPAQPGKPAAAKMQQPPAKPAAATKEAAKPAATAKKGEAKPAAKKGEGAAGGKGKLVMAKAAPKKKKAAGVRVDKEKIGGIKRRSVKDRVEALDHDKDTSRIIGLIATVGILLSVAGTVAWFIFFNDPGEDEGDPFDNIVLAEQPELTESRTFDFRHDGELVTVQIYERNTDGMEFVRIPAGTYTIGGGVESNEQPEVEVTVPEFYIGYNEVSARQYREFTRHMQNMSSESADARNEIEAWGRRAPGYARELEAKIIHHNRRVYNHPFDESSSTPSNFGSDDQAAHNLTWYEAFRYQIWANGMRPEYGILPTEVDWEVAARGTRGSIYPWGDSVDDLARQEQDGLRFAEMRAEDRADFLQERYGRIEAGVAQVAASGASQPPPNGFGIRNMFGNAAEYTWDLFSPGLYRYVRDINEPEFRAFGSTGGLETFREYGALPPRRTLRASSVGIQREQLTGSRFTNRVATAPDDAGNDETVNENTVGFRAVFYPDGGAPYGEELQALIDLFEFRREMPDYEAEDDDGEPTWTPEAERERRQTFEEEIRERLRHYDEALN